MEIQRGEAIEVTTAWNDMCVCVCVILIFSIATANANAAFLMHFIRMNALFQVQFHLPFCF